MQPIGQRVEGDFKSLTVPMYASRQVKVHSTQIFWKLHGVSNSSYVTAVNQWDLREGWFPYQSDVKYQYSFKEGRGEKSSPLHLNNICLNMLLKTSRS